MSTTTNNSDGGYNADDAFRNAYGQHQQELGRFNLAVIGKTGAGKSSLVNAIFGSEVAETGIGRPVTNGTTYYEHPSGIFGMYDCVGFETGESGDEILARLTEEIERLRERPLAEHMHVAWYVLRWSDRRFDDGQAAFVRHLSELGLPVVLVLSQVPRSSGSQVHQDAQRLADYICDTVGDVIEGGYPVLTNAVPDPFFGQGVHGLQELLAITFQAAPHGVRSALVAAQRIDMKAKRNQCRTIVTTAAAGAAAIGAVPIPFADAALLIPAQVGMMAAIAARYALPVTPETAATLAGAAVLAGGTGALVGRAVANLAKLIPGVGSVAGGAINATIASTLTTGIGLAWIAVCEHLNRLSAEEIDRLVADGTQLRRLFLDAFRSKGLTGWDGGLGAPRAA